MNIPMLKMVIAESGHTQTSLAPKLGYSKNTFNLKVNGKIPFTVPEANKLLEKIGIVDLEMKAKIFLQSSSQ